MMRLIETLSGEYPPMDDVLAIVHGQYDGDVGYYEVDALHVPHNLQPGDWIAISGNVIVSVRKRIVIPWSDDHKVQYKVAYIVSEVK